MPDCNYKVYWDHNKNLRTQGPSTRQRRESNLLRRVIPVVVRSDTIPHTFAPKKMKIPFSADLCVQATPKPPPSPDREIESTRNQIATRLSRISGFISEAAEWQRLGDTRWRGTTPLFPELWWSAQRLAYRDSNALPRAGRWSILIGFRDFCVHSRKNSCLPPPTQSDIAWDFSNFLRACTSYLFFLSLGAFRPRLP